MWLIKAVSWIFHSFFIYLHTGPRNGCVQLDNVSIIKYYIYDLQIKTHHPWWLTCHTCHTPHAPDSCHQLKKCAQNYFLLYYNISGCCVLRVARCVCPAAPEAAVRPILTPATTSETKHKKARQQITKAAQQMLYIFMYCVCACVVSGC